MHLVYLSDSSTADGNKYISLLRLKVFDSLFSRDEIDNLIIQHFTRHCWQTTIIDNRNVSLYIIDKITQITQSEAQGDDDDDDDDDDVVYT